MTHQHERRHEIGGIRRPDDGRPRWKLWLWRMDWMWRRFVPAICLILALVAVLGLQGKVDKTQGQVEAQREGRRVAIEVLCGGLFGVQEAGRLILLGELPPPAPKTPPISARERASRALYAQSYAAVISLRVLQSVGFDARGLVRPDGTIDCDKLKQISAAAADGGS